MLNLEILTLNLSKQVTYLKRDFSTKIFVLFVLTIHFGPYILCNRQVPCSAPFDSDQTLLQDYDDKLITPTISNENSNPLNPDESKAALPINKKMKIVDRVDLDQEAKIPKTDVPKTHTSNPPAPKKANPHPIPASPKHPGRFGPKSRLNPDYQNVSKISKFIRAIRKHWKYYFKKIIRKIVSTIVTNFAAGNQWRIINITPSSGNSTLGIPDEMLTPRALWEKMKHNEPDDYGDINGFLNQIIFWAPIGPFFRRVEGDLNMDLEQVINAFFLSPRAAINILSSGVNAKDPHDVSSKSKKIPPAAGTPIDPRFEVLIDRPPSDKSNLNGRGNKKNFPKDHDFFGLSLLKERFILWISSVMLQLDPLEDAAWLSFCPFRFEGQTNPSWTVCVVFLKRGRVDSIIYHHAPLF